MPRRALGLYLRSQGIATWGLGSGGEMRVFSDGHLVTTRFDGWSSWRELVEGYVAPSLGDDIASLTHLIDDWQPHVLVSARFAAAERLAAFRRRVAHVGVSIYPQQLARLPTSRGFASSFRAAVVREMQVGGDAEPATVTELSWGVSDDCVLLHDSALLAGGGDLRMGTRAVGFPYFDGLVTRPDDMERAAAWLASTSDPVVLVTFGSFLGVGQHELWSAAARD